MSGRDQPTPPFNSPYQQAMKPTSLLQSPAYPSPARSDSESSKYAVDGLGLYAYSQSFPTSGPPTSSVLYPPSPQPTEAWTHLSAATSPLMSEAHVDPWASNYDHPTSRSPLPWAPHHASHRSSLSSARDMSIFSHDGSEHGFPQIKLEGGSEWGSDEGSSPPAIQDQQPLTVAPERLTNSIFPYDHSYDASPLPRFDTPAVDNYDNRSFHSAPEDDRPRGLRVRRRSSGVTPRTRIRRNFSTPENAQHTCRQCGKHFQRKYNHDSHMQTHNPTRRKEHICEYKGCGKEFVRKTDLDRHERSVHLKARPFVCTLCDHSFARKDTLRRHEEDGCSRRNELRDPSMLSRHTSIPSGAAPMPYYPSPRSDYYTATQSPPLFQDGSYRESPRV